MTEEMYNQIDLIISDLIKNDFIVTNKGKSDLYDNSISFLKSKGIIKSDREPNRYIASSSEIYEIQKVGIKKYLKSKNKNEWYNKIWVGYIIAFIVFLFTVYQHFDNRSLKSEYNILDKRYDSLKSQFEIYKDSVFQLKQKYEIEKQLKK